MDKDAQKNICVEIEKITGKDNNDEPATQKQLRYMKNLGIEIPEGCKKRQASSLIDEKLGKTD